MLIGKEKLVSADVLVRYDPKLPLKLCTDASPYGVGAVLSHEYPDGTDRPILYASRSLTPTESNYAQIEKEALSIIFAIRKFHKYICGRHFVLVTDHKPLTTIFGPKKGIPTLVAARLQRWALQLAAHNYDIMYRNTKYHGNAALSRLPLEQNTEEIGSSRSPQILNLHQINCLPVTASRIEKATRYDPVLHKVLLYTQQGWPDNVSDNLKPFYHRRNELTVESNCIMWGIRVIIPNKFRKQILDELHESHMEICKMKVLARSHICGLVLIQISILLPSHVKYVYC